MLTRVVYAGYVEAPNWGVGLRKGKHEGLISFETFEKIQARLKSTAKAPARKDINADFPLRGFIRCNDCGKPLKACWSQGKYEKYPYYLCTTKGCASYRKSIKRDELEAAFEDVLQRLEPSENLFPLVRRLLPASLLLGASYMLLIDTLARTIVGVEVPLGILTALVGAPVFAGLLYRSQNDGWN